MRSRTFSILTIAGLLALVLAVGSALAQTSLSLKVDIPFEFVAGTTTLPAGEYTVQGLGISHTLLISSADRRGEAMMLTNGLESITPSAQSKLVFRKYGDRYFLSQVWREGDTMGSQLPVSKAERELTKHAANRDVVAVLAQR